MERLMVVSDVIYSIGYNAKKSDLEVVMKDGSAYLYLGVPANIYLEMMNSTTLDAYFEKKIKMQYVFNKMR